MSEPKNSNVRTAGEIRFIKDRPKDGPEWAFDDRPPAPSVKRSIKTDYVFDPKNLEPLAKTLRSCLMALGHIQTARTTFTKIKSQRISPDGSLGGTGYILAIKDIRKLLSNCDEALSSITDTIYDEIHAVHWQPDVVDSGKNPRARAEVKRIMDDVDEIKDDPEEWAGDVEAESDLNAKPMEQSKVASIDLVSRVAEAYLRRAR